MVSCCYLAWSDILTHLCCVYVSVSVCYVCMHAFLSLYTPCALELEEFLSALGWKEKKKKKAVRTGANFGSIQTQNLHLAPDWVKLGYTVHPIWVPASSESREHHWKQSRLFFSSAMRWQTGTWAINLKGRGFLASDCWDCRIKVKVWGGWWAEMKSCCL